MAEVMPGLSMPETVIKTSVFFRALICPSYHTLTSRSCATQLFIPEYFSNISELSRSTSRGKNAENTNYKSVLGMLDSLFFTSLGHSGFFERVEVDTAFFASIPRSRINQKLAPRFGLFSVLHLFLFTFRGDVTGESTCRSKALTL